MPGTTIRKSFPHARRMARTSWGDATTPSIPDFLARRANWTTRRDAGPAMPTPRNAALSILVRTVMASSLGCSALAGNASSLALAAARIISSPPSAWTSSRCTPGRPTALATAPLTVFGMSWNFRSRKTPLPSWANFSTARGPSAVNNCIFILKIPIRGLRDWASSMAGSSEGKSRARISLCRALSLRDVLAPPGVRHEYAISPCPGFPIGRQPGKTHPTRGRQ